MFKLTSHDENSYEKFGPMTRKRNGKMRIDDISLSIGNGIDKDCSIYRTVLELKYHVTTIISSLDSTVHYPRTD